MLRKIYSENCGLRQDCKIGDLGHIHPRRHVVTRELKKSRTDADVMAFVFQVLTIRRARQKRYYIRISLRLVWLLS